MDNLTEYRDNFKMAELILVRKISLKLLCVSSKNEKTKIKKTKTKNQNNNNKNTAGKTTSSMGMKLRKRH